MVTRERAYALVLVAVAAAGALAALWLRGGAGEAVGSISAARGGGKAMEIPRIDLARLQTSRPPAPAGRRDLFEYGPAPRPAAPAGRSADAAAPPPTLAEALAPAEPLPPPVPQLNVKYIGTVERKPGLKVAVLMTDKKEILTGQAGDVVANRLRIVKIGLESVDVQDVGSDSIRRIPLRGN